jgi:hypothetical protein
MARVAPEDTTVDAEFEDSPPALAVPSPSIKVPALTVVVPQ